MTIANSEKLMNTEATQLNKSGLRAQKRVDWKERIFHGLFLTSAVIGIVSLAVIAYFIVAESIPAFQEAGVSGIVLGVDWLPPALLRCCNYDCCFYRFNIRRGCSRCTRWCFNRYLISLKSHLKRLADIIRPAVELLAGIPSVVYGFFGLGHYCSNDSEHLLMYQRVTLS